MTTVMSSFGLIVLPLVVYALGASVIIGLAASIAIGKYLWSLWREG